MVTDLAWSALERLPVDALSVAGLPHGLVTESVDRHDPPSEYCVVVR